MSVARPRANRVTPFGVFEAVAAKGALMGNRGDLHASDGSLGRARWRGKLWIACSTAERGSYRVEFDRKGTYFPLFFSDEAVAFAAGHRPCASCRRADYNRFIASWRAVRVLPATARVTAAEVDAELHAARLDGKRQRTTLAKFGDLPSGSFIADPDNAARALRIEDGATYLWTHGGYARATPPGKGEWVTVLTPVPLLDVLRAGYAIAPLA